MWESSIVMISYKTVESGELRDREESIIRPRGQHT